MNWIKRLNKWLEVKEFMIDGISHKFRLIVKPGQKIWYKDLQGCPKCNSKNAHMGKSVTNHSVFGVFCPKCRKISFFTLETGTISDGTRKFMVKSTTQTCKRESVQV